MYGKPPALPKKGDPSDPLKQVANFLKVKTTLFLVFVIVIAIGIMASLVVAWANKDWQTYGQMGAFFGAVILAVVGGFFLKSSLKHAQLLR